MVPPALQHSQGLPSPQLSRELHHFPGPRSPTSPPLITATPLHKQCTSHSGLSTCSTFVTLRNPVYPSILSLRIHSIVCRVLKCTPLIFQWHLNLGVAIRNFAEVVQVLISDLKIQRLFRWPNLIIKPCESIASSHSSQEEVREIRGMSGWLDGRRGLMDWTREQPWELKVTSSVNCQQGDGGLSPTAANNLNELSRFFLKPQLRTQPSQHVSSALWIL